ncbi:MAG: phytoene/squalene synthase family protein [Myxococcota bacterium]
MTSPGALVAAERPDFRAVLGAGSKSFSFAAKFLPPKDRLDAAIVYTFCRTVDDAADDAPDASAGEAAVHALADELRGGSGAGPVVGAFLEVSERRGIDLRHAEELLEGVRSDLGEVRLPDDAALIRYGYRVAGTVGLLMCPIIGVRERAAYPFAVDLGVAMQITNICRDVAEDASRGRLYLPERRLVGAGLDVEAMLAGEPVNDEFRFRAGTVVRDVVRLADAYYASGELGFAFIPRRPRVAIAVASRVYRAIGHKLAMRGGDAFAGRTVVSTTEKLGRAAQALLSLALSPTWWKPMPEHVATLHTPLAGLPGANPLAGAPRELEAGLEGARA